MHRSDVAREIVVCCRRLWQAGLVAGQDGNVSGVFFWKKNSSLMPFG